MNFLVLNHNLKEQGTYFRAYQFSRNIVRLGHSVIFVTVSPNKYYRVTRYKDEGMEIYEMPNFSPGICKDDGWGPIDIFHRIILTLTKNIDWVLSFAHPPNIFIPSLIAKYIKQKKILVDICDWYSGGIFELRKKIRGYQKKSRCKLVLQNTAEFCERYLERWMPSIADKITVISKALEKRLISWGIPEQKILRIPSGAPLDLIKPLKKDYCQKELLNFNRDFTFPENAVFLGYIANYHPDEIFFLNTLKNVFDRINDVFLLSVGPPFTESILKELNIAERIFHFERQPFSRISLFLGASDILLLPLEDNQSNRGRWPNKIGDYLASGRPIVSNAVGDIANLFGEREIGSLSQPNPSDFANAIIDILNKKDRWEEFGNNSRKVAEENLNWESLTKKFLSFLED